MISFDSFTIVDGSPIYLQIIQYIKRGIIAGTIQDHDELPSRRVLSALLGVNPNTIQRAYRMLEEEGIIESRSGAKSDITVNEQQTARIRSQLIESDVEVLVTAMKQMGIAKEEALALISRIWN